MQSAQRDFEMDITVITVNRIRAIIEANVEDDPTPAKIREYLLSVEEDSGVLS